MPHRWSFFRAGGFDQVRLDTGADFAALAELDPKLWVALSCPTTGVEIDPHTLALLDEDKDGRVRFPEVLAAVKWAVGVLKKPDLLVEAVSAIFRIRRFGPAATSPPPAIIISASRIQITGRSSTTRTE